MLSIAESLVVVVLTVLGALVFLLLLHRVWPAEQRRQHNELIGWQVSVLGTMYAVIVGFMLYAVWTNFELANANAEAEANCVVNVFRSAGGLPAAQKQQIQSVASEYVDIMLTQEWPAMNRLSFSPASGRAVQQLWAILMKTEPHTSLEQASLDHTLSELTAMTEHRRTRQLQALSTLPGILWGVLIVGAVATIGSACLFGSVDLRLQLIQVSSLTVIIALALVAIADINRPFQGGVHVAPAGFERARATLDGMIPQN